MRIIIVGMGEIGLRLATVLTEKDGNELVVVDSDNARADEISSELDALVLNADGSNPDVLEKAQIEDADALVAATGSDQINTVIAMLGRNYGVEKVMVVLNEAALRPACRRIGVSAVFSPKDAAAAQMISTLYGFDRISFSSIASGGLKLDVIVVPEEHASKLSEIDVPSGVHLVAVRRSQDLMLPEPDLTLAAEDELILLFREDDDFAAMEERYQGA